MRGADIVIDQALYPRLYCMVSIEAMALGRPVLAAVDRRTLARLPPGCPVAPCGTTPETVAAALAYLLDAPGRCDLLGHQGVQYVARVHSPDAVREVLLG
jgi:glycosyltransferase involved in cell wall biosynthesis